jgi:hypothetical protein
MSVQDQVRERDDGGRLAEFLPARVVYIVGAGRSGSTILNAILGEHPDIVATGELRYLATPQDGGPRRCACGALAAECPYWQHVVSLWTARVGPAAIAEWIERRGVYERMRGLPFLAFDAAFRTSRWRSYKTATRALIDSVREAAGAKVVADSSKSPMRAHVLLRIPGLEMMFLHLVRDPRGVVWSRLKALGRQREAQRPGGRVLWQVVHSTLDWILVNLLSSEVLLLADHGGRFRYEDMAIRPHETLAAIEELLGVDLAAARQAIVEQEAIQYRHIVGGNPRRLEGPAPIVFDQDWRISSPAWVQNLVWRIAAPLARRYGYRR